MAPAIIGTYASIYNTLQLRLNGTLLLVSNGNAGLTALDIAECPLDCGLPVCGDGIPSTGEACDDANTVDGDSCSANCQSNETCGNGYTDALLGEVCDDGNDNGSGSGFCLYNCSGIAP